MSQGMPDSTHHAAPPVPLLPKDIVATSRPQTALMTDDNGQEFRVSFGSAFGSAMETGRIEPVYVDKEAVAATTTTDNDFSDVDSIHSKHQHQAYQHGDSHSMASPGRPATGPPSSLLARAAARASMASELDVMALNEPFMNNRNASSSTLSVSGMMINNSTAITNSNMNGQLGHSLISNSGPGSPGPITYPVRASSIRSEKRFVSTSPPQSSGLSRPPMPTGAAVISSTTRTAYTFQNSSSQVYIPQSSSSQQQQTQYQHITDSSGASISHHRGYRPSPNGSVSSMSTDYGGNQYDRRGSVSSNYDGNSTATDPTMIQAITQTMIGDYLWKYTRRPMASVISEKRHRRYFWVHPYNKTIYWSLNNPAADGSREQRAKSALIIAVFQITDENTTGSSDLPNVSLLVQTSNRNLKLTAPTREKHELWYQSLAYLLSRPSTPGVDMPSDNQTWSEVQAARGVTSDTLLTIRNDKTVRKKGSFNRLQSMFGRSKENSPTGSPRQQQQQGSMGMNSGMSSTSVNYSGMPPPPPLSGSSGSGVNGSVVNSVVGYPSHMVNSQNTVGGYGTMNGGPIMSQQASSSVGTNSMSPRSRLQQSSSSGAYEDEYRGEGEYDDEDDEDEDDEDDGELPEHVRQCCDGKHDIGSLDHHH
ncbi:hypothetical protein BGZ91_003315 [Linnemannia elongata]|nr:hypothetical protein BGZ91_003315 [Linnemannia elongata]